jgi:MFS family permease
LVLGAFATAAVALGAFVARSAVHPTPVIEFGLFRARSFAVANVGGFVFAIGFFALLLGNVLFLTSVWHYPVLAAGAALTPGPITATLMAPVAGRLADRFGQRAIAIPGCLVFAAGAAALVLGTDANPQYWSVFLPATVLTGAGIGLSLPAFGSAVVAELPRPRFATGVAIASCLRQIGAVVGVAVLVAVLGSPAPDAVVSAFHRCWTVVTVAGLASMVVSVALGRVRARQVEHITAAVRPTVEQTI